jgi:hypothetical protein
MLWWNASHSFSPRLNFLAIIRSLTFHLCRQHARNPSCTNLLISKNINNANHTFLWNSDLDSKLSLSNSPILFSHFAKSFHVKSICCCYRALISLFITQIRFSSFAIFTSIGLTTHSAHVNTVTSIHSFHTLVKFDWSNSFCRPKLNHGMMLK